MIQLTFEGTRGEVEEFSKKHKYHSSLLLKHRKFKLLIDYGEIHKYNLENIKPNAILITHAHPDHYIWTKENAVTKIPVYLTKETLEYGKFKPENYKIIKSGKKFKLNGFSIFPYKVLHSIKCPAIGFKILIGKKTFIYNPDLVDIVNKNKILENTDYYIGDGASLFRGLVRRRGNKLFGHTSIKTQINWCKKFDIKNVIFTHFGKQIIEMNDKKLKEKIKEYTDDKVDVKIAYDGMKVNI